jgi:hypothetical protein
VQKLLFEELEGLRDVRQSEEILTLSSAPMERLPELESPRIRSLAMASCQILTALSVFVRLASGWRPRTAWKNSPAV